MVDLGTSVGDIVGLFLFGEQSEVETIDYTIWTMNNETLPMNIQDIVTVVQGFVAGLGLTNNVTQLPSCVQSVENFTVIVNQAESLINNGSIQAIEEAIMLVGNSLQILGQVEYSCQGSYVQLKAYLVQFAEDIANSGVDLKGLEDLALNYPQTVTDGTAIVSYLNAKEWFNFGQALGAFVSYVQSTIAEADQQTFLAL